MTRTPNSVSESLLWSILMAVKVWPMLGGRGWITDPNEILSVSFAHTLAADESNIHLYNGNFLSMVGLIKKYNSNPRLLCNAIESQYTKFYNRLFDRSNISASYIMNDDLSYSVVLNISVMLNGIDYSLQHNLEMNEYTLTNTLKGISK